MDKLNIKNYIDKAGLPAQLRRMFDMSLDDLQTLRRFSRYNPGDAISLAFAYGRAKGYRAAQAERGCGQ